MIFLFTLFAITASSLLCFGQSKKRPPQNALPITTFNFIQLTGGVVIIKCQLDNFTDSLQFILDTGSGGISLDSSTAARLQIVTEASNKTIRGIAGIKKVAFSYNHQLKMPGLTVDSLDFHLNDYEILTGVYGIKIDGIIGFSFFKRYIVQLDFDTQKVKIYPRGKFTYPKGGHLFRPSIAGLPMQYATLEEDSTYLGRFYLDTGAGLCLLLSQSFVSDSSLFSPNKKLFGTIAEGLGGKRDMLMTVLEKFKLGPYKFKNMPVYIFEDVYNVTAYPHLSGLIGNDLLRRFNLTINYGRSEFHLLPNAHYREPFDYSYTGLGIYQEGKNIVVTDIIPNSPAQKAGLKIGDVVVGVANFFNGNMQDYKNALQTAGRRVKIIVDRNGVFEALVLVIESIKKK